MSFYLAHCSDVGNYKSTNQDSYCIKAANTAEYGDYISGPKVITEESRKGMKKILSDIQDGSFASQFIQEFNAGGQANFLAMRRIQAEHPVNEVGRELRSMMSWLQ